MTGSEPSDDPRPDIETEIATSAVTETGSSWQDRPIVRAGRLLFAIALVTMIVVVARDQAGRLDDLELDLDPWLMVAALVPTLVAGVVLPLAWRGLLSAWGERLGRRAAVRIWTISQAARYLPTGIAGFATRVVLVLETGASERAAGLRRRIVIGTLVLELVHLAAWAGLIGAACIPSSVLALPLRIALGAGMVAVLAAAPWIPRVAGRLLDPPDTGLVHRASLLFGANSLLKSARFVLVAAAATSIDGGDVGLLVGAEGLGVLAGLIGITPAGIGVREAVIAGALADRFGFANGLAIAALTRAVDLVAEAIWLATAFALRGRTP